ncbi:hypothetical protein DOTSEDRAFT_74998 [Dothistroma septosporum NZE10]|uniref:Uncharacterized protein n=1 Tax=Dothistroma septosporum (strain NZE10 / CBS 128990) TaxID=675120 RepID=N1PGD6_DOTSN|nr:hypothetical protein DOTSEDRAFT_74998 [Dothistroma septosporum NZE10]
MKACSVRRQQYSSMLVTCCTGPYHRVGSPAASAFVKLDDEGATIITAVDAEGYRSSMQLKRNYDGLRQSAMP